MECFQPLNDTGHTLKRTTQEVFKFERHFCFRFQCHRHSEVLLNILNLNPCDYGFHSWLHPEVWGTLDPQRGIRYASPALKGKVLTTEPGNSLNPIFNK